MADGKIYITISDKRDGSGSVGASASSTFSVEKKVNEPSDELLDYAKHETFHLIKDTAKTMMNYTLGNIGNLTGNYVLQRQVNVIKGSVENIRSIGLSTLAGAKYGPVGALVGFSIGVISTGIQTGIEIANNTIANKKTNYEIEQLRDRTGLNTYKDGSRGTEN